MPLGRKIHLITLAVIGWYLLLITLHYFNQRVLWNDEYCIYLNIHDRSAVDLFKEPLTHSQQFPRVYLYLIGQWSKQFNFHLLALRFFPFVCMTIAFLTWVYLARVQISSSMGRLTFILCWAASSKLIYYAAELKQYSMDVLAATVFILFLFHQKSLQEKNASIYIILLAILPLFGLFSYPVFFFLPLVAYNLLMDMRSNARLWPLLVMYVMFCLAVFAAVYFLDIRVSNVTWLATATDWNDHMVSLASPGQFFKTLGEGCDNLTSRWFAEHPKWIRQAARFFMALGFWRIFLGAWSAFKQDGFRLFSIRSVAFVVFGEHLILGILKKYPFVVGRTSLFFAPVLLFLTVDALDWIRKKNSVIYAIIQYPFLAYLCYVSLGIARNIFLGDLGGEPYLWY